MNKKTVQVRRFGRWERTLPQSLIRGDMFRIVDADGKIIVFPDKDTWKVAGRDAVVHYDGSVVVSWEGLIKF